MSETPGIARDTGGHRGRRYLLVGGTSGMGFATARILANSGARVALIGRDGSRSREVAATLGPEHWGGGTASDTGEAIRAAAGALGGVDGLAVTAGPINSRGTVEDLGDDDWAECFETILMTTVRSVRAVLPLLMSGGGGTIVTTAAYSVRAPKPTLPHYGAMKAAVANFSKNIAKSHGRHNIRVNCIAPGVIATEALDGARKLAAERYPDEVPGDALNRLMIDEWDMESALGRVGLPHEPGELIAFLLSPAAAFLTGALINIDGGTNF